jgi:anti-anti-sigma factor
VSGELDASTAPQLHHAVLAGHGLNTTLTLDLEAVTFMDVAGLTELETIGLVVQVAYQPMTLRRPSRAVRYLLDFRRQFSSSEPWVVETEGVTV